LEKLNKEDGITVICSLHYLDLVQRYATRVVDSGMEKSCIAARARISAR
jgi:ABC-type phosphate/phosphonate transport system ATPase subunit